MFRNKSDIRKELKRKKKIIEAKNLKTFSQIKKFEK